MHRTVRIAYAVLIRRLRVPFQVFQIFCGDYVAACHLMGLDVSVFCGFIVVKLVDLGVKRGNTIVYDIFLGMLYKHSGINIRTAGIRQFTVVPYMVTPGI